MHNTWFDRCGVGGTQLPCTLSAAMLQAWTSSCSDGDPLRQCDSNVTIHAVRQVDSTDVVWRLGHCVGACGALFCFIRRQSVRESRRQSREHTRQACAEVKEHSKGQRNKNYSGHSPPTWAHWTTGCDTLLHRTSPAGTRSNSRPAIQ